MAIPVVFDSNQKLFAVRIKGSSGYKSHGEDIDDFVRELTFKFPIAKRKQITAIRTGVNTVKELNSMKHWGWYITNDVGRKAIIDAVHDADQKMKNVDPTLNCQAEFLPLDLPEIAGSSTLERMKASLKMDVHQRALKYVTEKLKKFPDGKVPTKTVNGILNMLETMDGINVFDDPSVKQQIQAMRERVLAKQIVELKNDITAIISAGNVPDRFSSLELDDGETPPATAVKPEDLPGGGVVDDDDKAYAVTIPEGMSGAKKGIKPGKVLELDV